MVTKKKTTTKKKPIKIEEAPVERLVSCSVCAGDLENGVVIDKGIFYCKSCWDKKTKK